MTFKRTIENFVCERCIFSVTGNGYTNHCPRCLWSKHVDVGPGDRRAICGGVMEPARVEGKTGDFTLVHCCTRCGIEKRNKVAEEDDIGAIVALATHTAR